MWWRLAVLGGIGTASLMLAPIERLIPVQIDPLALRAMCMIQPALLMLLMTALGVWLAPKVGFDAPAIRAWAEGRSIPAALRPQLAPALLGGLIGGAILVAFAQLVVSRLPASPLLSFELPLATRLLYGGIVEELLLRWGLMSFLAWIAWRLGGRRRPAPGWCLAFGLVVSAILFAAGHLPLLYFLMPGPPDWLVGAVLAGNFVPGLLFGWLFWRKGLEAAIIAHALAHLFAWSALAIV